MSTPPRLPNFVVVGAAKSGTTSLYQYLRQHPDVFLPSVSEIHYFTHDLLAANAEGPGDDAALTPVCRSRTRYEGFYHEAGARPAVGEVSPSYLYYAAASERIHAALGPVKIVVLLRDPIARSHSQYTHLLRSGRETLGFWEALMAEEERTRLRWSDFWRYAESSLYAERLATYLERFGREQVKVVLFEDLVRDTAGVMRDLLAFLDVDPSAPLDLSRVHNRGGAPRSRMLARLLYQRNLARRAAAAALPRPVRASLRQWLQSANLGSKQAIDDRSWDYLRAYLRDDVSAVEELLGRRTGWLEVPADRA